MSGFDGTGPMRQGPQTGRKMGNCNPETDTLTTGFGRRCGFGKGLGRKMRLGSGWNSPGDGNNLSRNNGRRKK